MMHSALRDFVRQYLGVVAMALVPVVLTTFISIPMILGEHPGEPHIPQAQVERHLC